MSLNITLLGVFILACGAYIFLQFFSLWFEKHYSFMMFLLATQMIAGFWLSTSSLLHPIFSIILLIWSLLITLIFTAKYFFLSHLKMRKPKFITRVLTSPGLKHENIYVTTKDQVKIAAYHIRNNHAKVIILCHGGSRCKNSFENVGWAQWLASDYDVISFDFRGHFESGGYWTGDGKTKFDLSAIIEYAKSQGYQKIGVLGRSLGGWTAMLVASEIDDIDSLVIVSGVLGHIRATPMVTSIERLKSFPGRLLVRALQGLRYREYRDSDTLTPRDVAHAIKTPTLLIYSSLDPVIGVAKEDVVDFYNKIAGPKEYYIYDAEIHLPGPWYLGQIYRQSYEWFKKYL